MSDLEKSNRTKEHIPAKAFFVGYPIDYKNQRKTVPACRTCNEEYAKIDDELRDVIGILNNGEKHKSELTQKSVKKLLSNKKTLDEKMHIENDGISDHIEGGVSLVIGVTKSDNGKSLMNAQIVRNADMA